MRIRKIKVFHSKPHTKTEGLYIFKIYIILTDLNGLFSNPFLKVVIPDGIFLSADLRL